ncbi:MAG TPA: TetR/AcrR family transcriptional regulator [Phycisphaerae bacterium]|nr:TetR/AcrR family transcriptional regulator [Phycisphaerae bacterium]
MTTKTVRKRRELEQRRQEVLEVALDLFSRKGFEQTSMAEIAEQAGFAVGTLYTLFKDKNALYHRLIGAAITEFEQKLSEVLAGPDDEVRKVERYIETKAALFVKHRSLARIYFGQATWSMVTPLVGSDREIQVAMGRMLHLLESALSAGMRKRLLLKMDPKLLALGLEGLSNAFMLELMGRTDGYSADDCAEAVKKIFFEQIRLKAAAF